MKIHALYTWFFSSFVLLFLLYIPLAAQQLTFGPPDPLLHGTNCNIKSSPDISGDYYYVLYNDYGKRLDLNNNINSYLKIYSVKNGTLVKSVYLNSLVSGSLKRTRILFNDVIPWRDDIVGFFTTKRTSASTFGVHAQLFDRDGNTIGQPVTLGLAPRDRRQGSVAGQGGLFVNGRDTLAVADQLHFAFNSDSSRIALYTVTGSGGEAGFTIIGPDLKIISKVICKTPLITKKSEILQFRQYRNSILYLLCRDKRKKGRDAYVYMLLAVDVHNGAAHKISLSLPGKIILDALFSFDKQQHILLTGSYNDDQHGKHASTDGFFAMKIDGVRQKILHTDIRPLTPGIVKELAGKKAANKGKGLDEIIQLDHAVSLPGGNLVIFGQSHYKFIQVRGSTGALNSFYDGYGNVVFMELNNDGEIKWMAGIRRSASNLEMTTTTGPVYAFHDGNALCIIYDAESEENKHKQAIYFDTYDADGKLIRSSIPLPRGYEKGTKILWGTAQRVNAKKVIAAYYKPRKKEMGTVQIPLPAL